MKKDEPLNLNNPKAEFIRLFNSAGYSISRHDLFRDFLTMAFSAIAKTAALDKVKADALEERYMRVVRGYNEKDKDVIVRGLMPKLLALTQTALLPPCRCDFLGEIYHALELHNKDMGQFFTPFALSQLCAEMVDKDCMREVVSGKRKWVTIDEPAVGAGGMLLAYAHVAEAEGLDLSKQVWFRATDLSEMAFMMAYIQLSLRGMAGVVFRGNSLSLEVFEAHYTPAAIHFIGRNGDPYAPTRMQQKVRERQRVIKKQTVRERPRPKFKS